MVSECAISVHFNLIVYSLLLRRMIHENPTLTWPGKEVDIGQDRGAWFPQSCSYFRILICCKMWRWFDQLRVHSDFHRRYCTRRMLDTQQELCGVAVLIWFSFSPVSDVCDDVNSEEKSSHWLVSGATAAASSSSIFSPPSSDKTATTPRRPAFKNSRNRFLPHLIFVIVLQNLAGIQCCLPYPRCSLLQAIIFAVRHLSHTWCYCPRPVTYSVRVFNIAQTT